MGVAVQSHWFSVGSVVGWAEAGGYLRGEQSAYIKVVKVKSSGISHKDTSIEIRVEDSNEPLIELERLYKILKDELPWKELLKRLVPQGKEFLLK